MALEKMPSPAERSPRWMGDKELNQTLVIEDIALENNDTIEITFLTPLQEKVRRQVGLTSPEYNFLYNKLGTDDWTGAKVTYGKNQKGYRTPVSANLP